MRIPNNLLPLPWAVELDPEVLAAYPLHPQLQWAVDNYGFDSVEDAAVYLLCHSLPMPNLDNSAMVPWIPSGRFNPSMATGPIRSKVVVLGKMPGNEELYRKRNFVGPSGDLLRSSAEHVGIGDLNEWYIINIVRYPVDTSSGKISAEDLAVCWPLLMQELKIVKPEFMLLLGADATKAVCGKRITLSSIRSHALATSFENLGKAPRNLDEVNPLELEYASYRMLATVHPAAVLREDGLRPGFERDLELFKVFRQYGVTSLKPGEECEYRYLTKVDEVKAWVDAIAASGYRDLAVDCEWGGGDYTEGWLRTVQFCWKERTAVVVVLHGPNHKELSPTHVAEVLAELRRLTQIPDIKFFGHNMRADLKWLEDQGVPMLRKISFDTMLADHILNENAEHGLDACAIRYTDMGRYDYELAEFCRHNSLTLKNIRENGYAVIPDEILFPYGACDADATFRCKQTLVKKLAEPDNAKLARLFYEIVLPATMPIHEIETNGILVDADRMSDLTTRFEDKKQSLLHLLRKAINRPTFNPRSVPQMRDLLFGPVAEDGLGLEPYKTTEKPPRMWEDLEGPVKLKVTPSTDIETLEALSFDNPVTAKLRDYKIIDQVTKSFLRQVEADGKARGGLTGAVDKDGRIRTTISQMSETGRWKSSGPNLANLPKKQDKQLDRIMGPGVPKIRSCFLAEQNLTAGINSVLIEADYKSAEIYTLGYLANETKLIQDANSDLHARGAVTRFGAAPWDGFEKGTKPPKEWLEKYKALRVCSKTISFGIPYQRGAKAIAREIMKSTNGAVVCDRLLAQSYIDGFYGEYAGVKEFVELCKDLVIRPGWLDTPWGRRRRFFAHESSSALAAHQREAVNFPIQASVADALNQAAANFYYWRELYPGRALYKLLLTIYDAVLLEVPGEYAQIVVEDVIPQCMTHGVVIPSWQPLPGRQPTTPFSLETDIEVSVRWGEKATAEQLRDRGVSEALLAKLAH